MSFVRLGLWLMQRERRSGEWRVLLFALIVGVGSVATTGFLGDRVERAMREEGSRFLGADLVVISPRAIDAWPEHALETSHVLEFSSMLARGDAFQLATVRAVDSAYPLRGTVRIAERPFEPGATTPAQPPPGAIHVAPELLPLLGAEVGDNVQIGAATLRIAGVVVEEPGQLGGVFGLAPRVLMHANDVEKTQVLQPGSRVTHLYQFAGSAGTVEAFATALKQRLDRTQRLLGAREGVETLRGAFADTDRYLQLAGLVSLLLAAVAIAIAARRHALRRYDQAALLRCFGATTAQLRAVYAAQLVAVAVVGSAVGIGLGALTQQALAQLILPGTATRLPELGLLPAVTAMASGLLALAGGALPALLRLVRVPPLRVLRRELPPLPLAAWVSVSASGLAFAALIAWHARDLKLIAIFVGALTALAVVLALLARLALVAGHAVHHLSQGPVRFGLGQLVRHRLESTLQVGAFALALFLVALLALVRGDLIDRWQAQLPADAPNHFLVNIAPEQEAAVARHLATHGLAASRVYPMVRGRLVGKNGAPIDETLPPEARDSNTLRRELNLTWSDTLPPNNSVLAGRWHGNRQVAEVSVESGMAERLGLALGDALSFQVGDQTVSATVTSVRQVQWESMQPNFFVIFAPGQLDALPSAAIASVRIPPSATGVLPDFVRAFPGVTVLALDKLIANIQAVFDQIVNAVQLLLGFLLAAGTAVVLATLLASVDARRQEAVLLRTLGAERAYLARALWSEFLALGALAGLLAAACAELAMALIGERLFDLSPRLHPLLWAVLPAASALLVGTAGWLTTRHITRVPPMQSLRALD